MLKLLNAPNTIEAIPAKRACAIVSEVSVARPVVATAFGGAFNRHGFNHYQRAQGQGGLQLWLA